MPALDAFGVLAPKPAATANHYAATADHSADHAPAGDEFSRMMDQALAPATPRNQPKQSDAHKATSPAQVPTNRPKPSGVKASVSSNQVERADSALPTATDSAKPGTDHGGDQASGQPNAADRPATDDLGTAKAAEAATPSAVPAEPVPVFLSLPLAAYYRAAAGMGSGTAAQNTLTASVGGSLPSAVAMPASATTSTSAATSASGTVAGEADPVATKAPAATAGLVASNSPVSDEKAALLKSLAPSLAAQAGAGTEAKPAPVASPASEAATNQLAGAVPLTASAPLDSAAATANDPVATATLAGAAPALEKLMAEKLATSGKVDAVENGGTGVAFNDSAMKKNENTNKVAGLDVKVLPGSVTELVREKNLPPHLVVTPVNTPENRPNDLNGMPPLGGTPTAEATSAVNVVDLPSLTDARMRALERTHDMVSLHAMRLVESKSDTLQVTIKPAVGTELSLELRHRNGTIEAQATVERGDFQFLNQHWPELQQKLEQRGIKLSPLGGEANLLANDNGESRRQAAQEEEAMHASAFAEFASVGNLGGASARLAVDYDGWESWA